MTTFEFEVQCYQRVTVNAKSKDEARDWLINHLDNECSDILDDAFVSDGVEK